MELPIEDVLEIQQLNAIYALRMTQGDINHIMEEVFTADGSYSAFGDTYGLADWPSLVEAAPKGLFLTGEPMLELDGDKGTGQVPLLFVDQTNHHMRMGDRKSVVSGKSVSGRVDLGCRRIIQKKTQKNIAKKIRYH